MNHHRDAISGVARIAFEPRHSRSMVAIEKHNRVLLLASTFQLIQFILKPSIHVLDIVVVLAEVLTNLRKVRPERRQP